MLNEECWEIARIAAEIAHENGLFNIEQVWLYSQFMHESNGMSSRLTLENHNIGGLTQLTPNDSPQPDGKYYYINFDSFEDYAKYFGKYLLEYEDGSGVQNATCMAEYIMALKDSPSGAYFGDTYENYINGCRHWFEDAFGEGGNANG